MWNDFKLKLQDLYIFAMKFLQIWRELHSRMKCLEKIEEINQNSAGPENFHIFFLLISGPLLPKLNFLKWDWALGIFSIGVCDTPTFFYIPFLYTFFYIQSTQQCQWEKEKKILLFGFLNKNIIQFLQFLGEIRGYLKHIFGNCRYKGLNIKHWVWTFNGCGPR